MLSLVLAASFWVLLGALLASFRVLLVAPRCLLGLSWLPLDALEALFATDSAVRGAQKRRPNIVIFDARRAGLGAQNPPEEGSQGVKRPARRALTEMRRDEKQSIVPRQIELIIVNVF